MVFVLLREAQAHSAGRLRLPSSGRRNDDLLGNFAIWGEPQTNDAATKQTLEDQAFGSVTVSAAQAGVRVGGSKARCRVVSAYFNPASRSWTIQSSRVCEPTWLPILGPCPSWNRP